MNNRGTDPKKTRAIELPLTNENYGEVRDFIEQRLSDNHISQQIIYETLLLVEALYESLIERGFGRETLLTVSTHKTFGEFNIKLGFEGEPFASDGAAPDGLSPELSILQAYRDKYNCRYSYGYNTIGISVKRSYKGSMLRCWAGIFLAILVYIPISMTMSVDERIELETKIVYPCLKQFANAMLMVGAPITLFSLVRNLTDIYVISERNTPLRKLQRKAYITSCISIVLGIVAGFIIMIIMEEFGGYLSGFGGRPSATDVINSLVPSSIFEPFETYMPFPMIIVAILIVYAFCSAGEYIDILRKAVDICYTLFSKMLNVVMFFLPFFSFLAMLTPLLKGGIDNFMMLVKFVVLVIASLSILAAFYLLRLKIGGVKLGPFLKHIPSLTIENLRINSVIDAVPFNIRFCARNYGFNRKRISVELPILAQVNLDGNCYLIMLVSMMITAGLGVTLTWVHLLVIIALILFLSLGAPNQPGSMLIGVLIILFYLQADNLISMAIYMEVFFGVIQNIINVLGDIVTVAVEHENSRRNPSRTGKNAVTRG